MNRRPPKVLLVDNYDSFVGNLYQYFGELGAAPALVRNDAITPEEVVAKGYTHLVISPGPKTPAEAGASVELIRRFAGRRPILGVCLGHQAIGAAFGGRVGSARRLLHGKTSRIEHDGRGLFAGLPASFTAARYHSLALPAGDLPAALEITARAEDGEVMGVRHRRFAVPVEGVQFHPESILTENGKAMLANFLDAPVGLFETLLVRDGAPVRLAAHLKRLAAGAARAGFPLPASIDEIGAEIRARAAPLPLGRVAVYADDLGTRTEAGPYEPPPAERRRDGGVALLEASRGHPHGRFAGLKIHPRPALARSREAARAAGADDAILVDEDGALLEGTAANLFLVRAGVLVTPPLSRPVLPGTTRAAVLAAAARTGVPSAETDLFESDLAGASEAFLAGSLMEILPLRRLGDRTFAPGPVAARIAAVLGETADLP